MLWDGGVLWDSKVCCGMARCAVGWRGVLWDDGVPYEDEDIARCVFCFLCLSHTCLSV